MARDWNAAYEEGDTPWDKGYASPPLIEFLKLQSNFRILVQSRVVSVAAQKGFQIDIG